MRIKSSLTWLHYQQLISWELEESIYWALKNYGIYRFCFEYLPENPNQEIINIWLPLHEFSLTDRDHLVNLIQSLFKAFDVKTTTPVWREVEDEDWSLSWKENWLPDPVGKSILILPSWLETPKEYLNRKVILLDPGCAFGTGSHPTTRLCLEALESEILETKEIIDIGCGSGILSLTALSLGAKYVSALDIDSLAIEATKQNFLLNNISDQLFSIALGSIDILENQRSKKKFDLILCNTLAPILKDLLPGFDDLLKNNGKAFLSGLLASQVKDLTEFVSGLGFDVLRAVIKDKWALIEICRKSENSTKNFF